MMRLQARPRVRRCHMRLLWASVESALRRRLLHAQRNFACLRLSDSLATGAWPPSAAIALVAALYYLTPNVRPPSLRWITPGGSSRWSRGWSSRPPD